MNQINQQIEDCIAELENYSPSLAKLSNIQYALLKQTKERTTDFEDFLNNLKGSVAIFKKG
ncbi:MULTISPECIES: hypothetical protein [unclassified Streptococcus]|uniref:hypothetical protein n=1 Tax=unclassified Streptococcus TaxID=2608887 RepID=UPI0010727E8C|nr:MULTISPECIES: hypothetical protein [unclassified Streptococcus]MBF0786968.1 hypothetical protein [Streptococcus sp. 19428wC2_LYSM12]MCQ9211512.1 hypothetical protein [Streptococcus sp. B01]MCQ9214828.1 hypothetical protein [Streptococcus sp. O1]TFV06167.1 hypothetical protein E4T79_03480 [Streptococcus sp. LYSM12]